MALSQVNNGDTGLQARDKINAALSAVSALIAQPNTVYCSASLGNDSTAVVGDPSHPYATAQAAFNAWTSLNAAGRLHVMDGSVGSILTSANMSYSLLLTGNSLGCSISFISSEGSGGGTGGEMEDGYAGSPGRDLDLVSDGTVTIGYVTVNGGAGGAGGSGGNEEAAPKNGGQGANSGRLRMRGLFQCGEIYSIGGNGGLGNMNSGNGGNGGSVGTVIIDGLVFCTSFYALAGTGGYSAGGGSSGTSGGPAGQDFNFFARGVRASGAITLDISAISAAQFIDSFAPTLSLGSATAVACYTHGSLPSW